LFQRGKKKGGGGGVFAENCIMRASLFALLTKYYSGEGQGQRDGQGMQHVWGEQKCIQGRIILKWALKRYNKKV